MLLASVTDEVRIVEGKLLIPEATRCLLGRVLAPTDNPRTQLRHLAGILDELDVLASHGGSSFNRLTVAAAKQLKESIQVELSYGAFLRSAGGPAQRAGASASA